MAAKEYTTWGVGPDKLAGLLPGLVGGFAPVLFVFHFIPGFGLMLPGVPESLVVRRLETLGTVIIRAGLRQILGAGRVLIGWVIRGRGLTGRSWLVKCWI